MNDVLDYLKWRGDLTFSQDPFNEIDNLIFSILCYNDFGGIVPNLGEMASISLYDASIIFKETKDINNIKKLPFLKIVPNLLEQASQTKRFKNIKLSNYVDNIDIETTKQFSALVFKIEEGLHIIAFRGTDDSLVGWKEDLQMSFMEEVESQKESVIYTEKIMENIDSKFILVGHSKGGNLAIFAASFIDKKYSSRIYNIYNNDGPGFQPKIINSKEYKNVLPKIYNFLPESSIIGMLLEQEGDYEIVKSSGLVSMQHNPFLWELEANAFIRKDELTEKSLNINKTIRAWIKQLSNEERADFVDSFFEILQNSGAISVADLNNKKLITEYLKMDKDTKEHLKNTIQLLFEEGKKVLRNL